MSPRGRYGKATRTFTRGCRQKAVCRSGYGSTPQSHGEDESWRNGAVTGGDEEIMSLVAYLRSLKSTGTAHEQTANANGMAPPIRTREHRLPRPQRRRHPHRLALHLNRKQEPSIRLPPPRSRQIHRIRAERLFTMLKAAQAVMDPAVLAPAGAPELSKFSKATTPAALTRLLEDPSNKMKVGGMAATNLPATEMSALVAYLQNLGTPATAPPAQNFLRLPGQLRMSRQLLPTRLPKWRHNLR